MTKINRGYQPSAGVRIEGILNLSNGKGRPQLLHRSHVFIEISFHQYCMMANGKAQARGFSASPGAVC
jgi:hypothetical protein